MAANRERRGLAPGEIPLCRGCGRPLDGLRLYCTKDCRERNQAGSVLRAKVKRLQAELADRVAEVEHRNDELVTLRVELASRDKTGDRSTTSRRSTRTGRCQAEPAPLPNLPLATATALLHDVGLELVGPGESNRELAYRLQEVGDVLDPPELSALIAELRAAENPEQFVLALAAP